MTLDEIRRAIARNLGMLSSDNTTIRESAITKAGMDEEINRVWQEVICQTLMSKSQDDFTVEGRLNTFSASFIVASIDINNKLINSTANVFGRADEGCQIQNPSTGEFYTITQYITATQVQISETPSSAWVGDTVYILNNIIVLDPEANDIKEILKFQIKPNPSDQSYIEAQRENVVNFRDTSNYNIVFSSDATYTLTTIKVGDVMKRCIIYYPFPTRYDGVIKLNYTQRPAKLLNDTDEPTLSIIGISETIINGVTAWGFRLQNDLARAQTHEENNPSIGGIVPKGLTLILKNYKPNRGAGIRYRGLRSHR